MDDKRETLSGDYSLYQPIDDLAAAGLNLSFGCIGYWPGWRNRVDHHAYVRMPFAFRSIPSHLVRVSQVVSQETTGSVEMAKGIGHDFMMRTRYRCLDISDQMRGRPQPPLELEFSRQNDVIKLPPVEDSRIRGKDLLTAIESRRSIRSYSTDPLALSELSLLLWVTQGVKEVLAQTATLRTVPSAGARHAFETFLLVNNVASLKPGLYRFLATQHKLAVTNLTPDVADMVVEGCLGQAFVKQCAVTFIWVAIPYRMNWRYGERGYRYLHLDAGHVCQNLYLAAESIHCGVCAIAAFEDDTMNRILGLDGEEQFVIYIATVGRKLS